MFRSTILAIFIFTVARAAPAPAALPVSRSTFTCSNQCIPVPNFPCPAPCQAKSCTYKIPHVTIPGTACTKPSPSPTPSATPTPSVTPSPDPQIERCRFDIIVIGDLQFACDCTTATGGDVSSVIDAESKFSGTNLLSKNCFESCLVMYAIPACQSKDLSAFEDVVNDNFHTCCSSCDAKVDNGVCVPFEP